MKKTFALAATAILLLSIFGCQKKAVSDYEYIKSKGKMVVGITLFKPMNYQATDGTLIGFDTEFAREAAARLGVEAEFIEINWDFKETELSSKNIDCIWNGMTITEPLKQNLSVSNPYLSNRQILITKSDKAQLYSKNADNISISVEQGSAGETITSSLDFFAKSKITPVDSQTKALLEVKAGLADAAVVDYVISFGAIGEGTDFADLAMTDAVLGEPELYGIAFRKGSDMTQRINAIIDDMTKDGTLKTIAEKYHLEGLLVK